MKAAVLEEFGKPLSVRDVASPEAGPGAVVADVAATATPRLLSLVRAGLLDLGQDQVTTFSLDQANDAVQHAAAHGGPFERTVITPG